MAGKHGRNGYDDDNVNPFAVSAPPVTRTALPLRRPFHSPPRSRGELACFSYPITSRFRSHLGSVA